MLSKEDIKWLEEECIKNELLMWAEIIPQRYEEIFDA